MQVRYAVGVVSAVSVAVIWGFAAGARAAMEPGGGHQAVELYTSAGSFQVFNGLAVDGPRLYFGQGSSVLALDRRDLTVRLEGATPPDGVAGIAAVERLNQMTFLAYGTSYASPFPYKLGRLLADGSYTNVAAENGIFDMAVDGNGRLYVAANPDPDDFSDPNNPVFGTGTEILRYDPQTGSLTNIVTVGGYTGGLAFDRDDNLYYAEQTLGQIWKFTPAQLAAGGLTGADAQVVLNVTGGGFLCFDDHNNLYVTENYGGVLSLYDLATGRLLRRVASYQGPLFGGSIGKMVWERGHNRLFVSYNDWNAFDGTLFEIVPPHVGGDFDRDARTDLALYAPASGAWFVRNSDGGAVWAQGWLWNAVPVPQDYDGDARSDVAVFDPASGNWFNRLSSDGTVLVRNWGWNGTTPVPADYDGDGLADLAVFHAPSGNWFIQRSSDGAVVVRNWGWNGTQPVVADYDGDLRADTAVYFPALGDWWILRSSDGSVVHRNWGWIATSPQPEDFDGDGRADLAVFHNATGNWYLRNSADGSTAVQNWGGPGFRPVAGEYDGDGKADFAVFVAATADWWILNSRDGSVRHEPWGPLNAVPVLR